MLTTITTSQWQGQHCEVLSEGSRRAKQRADEQEPDIRLSRRAKWAHDHEDHEFARQSKSGGCAVKVHALIWGDLPYVRCKQHGVLISNGQQVRAEVSSGHSNVISRMLMT